MGGEFIMRGGGFCRLVILSGFAGVSECLWEGDWESISGAAIKGIRGGRVDGGGWDFTGDGFLRG